MSTIVVVGSGMMGSALAMPLCENGHKVRLVGSPLDNAIIESTFQYGVSNEPKGTPRVSVKQGKLLIMEIYK